MEHEYYAVISSVCPDKPWVGKVVFVSEKDKNLDRVLAQTAVEAIRQRKINALVSEQFSVEHQLRIEYFTEDHIELQEVNITNEDNFKEYFFAFGGTQEGLESLIQ